MRDSVDVAATFEEIAYLLVHGVDEAIKDEADGKAYVIGLSGNGQLDLPAYELYLSGDMSNA